MPQLPQTTEERLTALASLMHEQDDEQLNRIVALEKLVQVLQGQLYALQATVAVLQGHQPSAAAVDQGDEAAIAAIFDAVQGASQVEKAVEGRKPQ